MIKDAAPTELISASTAEYYKGFTPTELFSLSKIGKSSVSIINSIEKVIVSC